MDLHQTVERFVATQNSHDSSAYSECFADQAIVHDEGKTHTGKAEIKQWNEESNREYQTVLQPISYKETAKEHILTAEVSGTFSGSPATLQFHIRLKNQLIESLHITG